MNFMGVGPLELVVILVVALVVVGPERLPKLAADIARTIREIRKYTGSLASEFTEIVQEFEKDTEGDRGQWKEIGDGLTNATKSVTEAIRGARADASLAGTAPSATPEAAPATTPATPPGEHWLEIGDMPPPPALTAPDAPAAIHTNGAAAAAPAATDDPA
jgi:Tat protein translocase TatB subunit